MKARRIAVACMLLVATAAADASGAGLAAPSEVANPDQAAAWRALAEADAALARHDLDAAATALRTALRAARTARDIAAQGEALMGVALVQWYRDQPVDAAQHFANALPLLRRGDRLESVAVAQLGLGLAATALHDDAEAVSRFKRGVIAARSAALDDVEARGLRQLARAYQRRRDPGRALACWQQRLAVQRRLHDRTGAAHTLRSIGLLERQRGRASMAQAAFDEALAEAQALGDRPLAAATLRDLGELAWAEGHPQAARRLLQAARREAVGGGGAPATVHSLEGLAALARAEGREGKALRVEAYARALGKRHAVRSEVWDG